jgi:hypothetical protein
MADSFKIGTRCVHIATLLHRNALKFMDMLKYTLTLYTFEIARKPYLQYPVPFRLHNSCYNLN